MDVDEAVTILIGLLKADKASSYGYDLYPRKGAEAVAIKQHPQNHNQQQVTMRELSPVFFDAAWELCRRGVVRPGVKRSGDQAVDEGGYSLTEAGRKVLQYIDEKSLVILQAGSLAETFKSYQARFGDGFYQRSMEAIRCRNAEAWLACCAMAGAAAESVLLALAIAKEKDEDAVVRAYSQAGGRQKVLNMVVGQAKPHHRNMVTTFAGIISLWRDEAAHGKASFLGTANADEALRQLLHMCQWVDKEWDELVGKA
jgi:hypothetical protein